MSISQQAREAAAALMAHAYGANDAGAACVRSGECDGHTFVQAFAAFEAQIRTTLSPPADELRLIVARIVSPRFDNLCDDEADSAGAATKGMVLKKVDQIIALLPSGGGEKADNHLRPEVRAFAHLMEAQLRANDHKPGWKRDDPTALACRAEEELAELKSAVENWSLSRVQGMDDIGRGADPLSPAERAKIVGEEAADVANFAMMVADVCGALPATPTVSPELVEGDAVERVARAIWHTAQGFAQLDAEPEDWDLLPDYAKDRYRDQARAAIAATPAPLPSELVALPRDVIDPLVRLASFYSDGIDDHQPVPAGIGYFRRLREAVNAFPAPPPSPLPSELIERLRKLLEEATPVKLHNIGGYLGCKVNQQTIFHLDEIGQEYPSAPFQAIPFARAEDAAYAAAAWNALPALLDAIEGKAA